VAEAASPVRVDVAISIDTEEDNWGSYSREGATTANIGHLPYVQEIFDRWGARPTYLVNRPPLLDRAAVETLGALASRGDVEIGAHCHPWNTPPFAAGNDGSMMSRLSAEENHAKLKEVGERINTELGIRPTTFRAGRWGFGASVADALVKEGYRIDCSVTPFLDWTSAGGPDYTEAPHRPYRFHPGDPMRPEPAGSLLELPVTIGFLRAGDQRTAARRRKLLERSPLGQLGAVGIVDRVGFLAMRWLSPETSSGKTMVRVAENWVASGESFLHATFHSCALLPGMTPFVRTEADRTAFLEALGEFLAFCKSAGFGFKTLTEAAEGTRVGHPTTGRLAS